MFKQTKQNLKDSSFIQGALFYSKEYLAKAVAVGFVFALLLAVGGIPAVAAGIFVTAFVAVTAVPIVVDAAKAKKDKKVIAGILSAATLAAGGFGYASCKALGYLEGYDKAAGPKQTITAPYNDAAKAANVKTGATLPKPSVVERAP